MISASCDLSLSINDGLKKFLLDCLDYTENIKGSFIAKFSGKDMEIASGYDRRTIRRNIYNLKNSQLVKSIQTRRGRSGGYIIEFNDDLIHFNVVSNVHTEKAPDEPLKTFKPTRKERKEFKGERDRKYDSLLKTSKNKYDVLMDYDGTGNTYYGYLLSKVYDAYVQLFSLETSLRSEYNFDIKYPENYTQFGNGKIIGSANLTTFTKLYVFCKENNINPVYYISAIFEQERFLTNHFTREFKVPYVNTLLGRKDNFLSQREYDKKYFFTDIKSPHETIRFVDNPVVGSINNLFMFLIYKKWDIKAVSESYQEDLDSYTEEVIRLGYMSKDNCEFEGNYDEIYEKVTRSGTGLLEEINKKSSDDGFNRTVGRLYATSIKGIRFPYRSGILYDANVSKSYASLFNGVKQSDIKKSLANKDDLVVDDLYSSVVGFSARESHVATGDIINFDDIREELMLRWPALLNWDSAVEVGSLIGDQLGLSNYLMTTDEFNDKLEKEGQSLLPLDGYGKFNLPLLVKGFSKKSADLRSSENRPALKRYSQEVEV